MIGHFVDHAKLRLEAVTTHYGGRVLVAVPIVIAAGFGIAAIYLLIEAELGAIWASVIMAGLFLVLAIVVAMAVLARERSQRVRLRESARQSALMAGLLSAAPAAISGGRRVARRMGVGMPIVLGSALLAAIMASRGRHREDVS